MLWTDGLQLQILAFYQLIIINNVKLVMNICDK